MQIRRIQPPNLLGGPCAGLRLLAWAASAWASVLIGTTQEPSLGSAAVARVLDRPSDSAGP